MSFISVILNTNATVFVPLDLQLMQAGLDRMLHLTFYTVKLISFCKTDQIKDSLKANFVITTIPPDVVASKWVT